jgi:hypothetical protein
MLLWLLLWGLWGLLLPGQLHPCLFTAYEGVRQLKWASNAALWQTHTLLHALLHVLLHAMWCPWGSRV